MSQTTAVSQFETSAHARNPLLRLPQEVRVFALVLLLLTAVCLIAELICSHLGLPYPYDWPLFPADQPFRDFTVYRPRMELYHTRAFFTMGPLPVMYPAPALLLYRIFFSLPHATAVYVAAFAASAAAAAVAATGVLRARGISLAQASRLVACTVLCCYPFWFCFEQGNIEWVLWVVATLGVIGFLCRRNTAAAILMGVAGSIKLFPIILLGLFLARKQYRECILGIATAAAVTVTSLWLAYPDVAYSQHEIAKGIAAFQQIYVLGFPFPGFDHSLFGLYKSLVHFGVRFHGAWLIPPRAEPRLALHLYMPLVAVLGTVAYFGRIRRLPVVNQVICLVVASIWLPPLSFDYTLLHLALPWFLLVLCAVEARGRRVPGLLTALVCFAILMAPETELIVKGHVLGGPVKALTLLVLFVTSLRWPCPTSMDEPASRPAGLAAAAA